MRENREFQPEISKEHFEQSVRKQMEMLWENNKFVSQYEINFVEGSIKPGGIARATAKADLSDPESTFVLTMKTGESGIERDEIAKQLDWVIPHEIAHAITEKNKEEYAIELSERQREDLNNSTADLKPEIFLSGADEIATDVVGWNMANKQTSSEEAMVKSLEKLISIDAKEEQAGELTPFYRDQARFTALVSFLEKQEINMSEYPEIEETIYFWNESRGQILDEEDSRRFDELVTYLEQVAEKAKEIEI